MSWITSPIFKPGDADADIAAHDPRRGQVEPSLQALVYDKQIAQSVSAQQQSLILGSIF